MRRLRSGLVLSLALAACASDAHVSGLAIRDPLGLIDDVYASGNALRLVVLPADPYACDPSSGVVSGWDATSDEVPVGMAADAVVDVALESGDTVGHEVTVPTGTWTVLVRGIGDDTASGRMDVLIATGCQQVSVENGQTVAVTVMLAPVTVMGMCGDGLLSADEQCEGGPNCTDCRTTAEPLNTTAAGPQQRPRVAARSGQRTVALWDDLGQSPQTISLRYFDPDARPLSLMGPLEFDTTIDMVVGTLPGVQTAASVAVGGDGRVAIAFADLAGATQPDARLIFMAQNRTIMGTPIALRADAAGAQNNPAVAISGSNATMVVFEDARSSTGVSGRVVPMGSTTPAGSEAFEVGTGRTGGTLPAIAGAASGFVVALAAGGDIVFQRFMADGTAIDASAVSVGAGGGSRDLPSVAALPDGSFLVAWAEANGDGMGSAVKAVVVSAAGAPGTPFTVNTTVAGDQTRPAVAASDTGFLVAFESAGSVRARALGSSGEPALNRERPPTFGDFEVAPAGAQPAATVVGSGAMRSWWVAFGSADDVFARRFPL